MLYYRQEACSIHEHMQSELPSTGTCIIWGFHTLLKGTFAVFQTSPTSHLSNFSSVTGNQTWNPLAQTQSSSKELLGFWLEWFLHPRKLDVVEEFPFSLLLQCWSPKTSYLSQSEEAAGPERGSPEKEGGGEGTGVTDGGRGGEGGGESEEDAAMETPIAPVYCICRRPDINCFMM